jgi:CelD/BcsL family acetyltransferase involved in cellulose biosynthesis
VDEMSGMSWNFFTAVHMEDNRAAGDLLEAATSRWQDEGCSSGISISIPVPEKGDIIDQFGKNARKNVRQSIRDLGREGLDVSFREVPQAEAGRFVDTYIRQHIGRWASKGGSIFETPEHARFLRAIVERACANGQGFAHELLIGGEVAAQNFGFIDGDKAYSYRTGMNEAFARSSPGWLLKIHGMEALREKGIRRLVLGLGAEAHKYRMGGEETKLVGVRVSRGMLSAVTRATRCRPARYLGSKMGTAGRSAGQGGDDQQ